MAVYTEVTAEDLHTLLKRYGIGELTAFKGIAEGVENSNFYVGTSQGQFILTLYEKRVASADLPFFLGLMEHLARKNIHCPTPVHDRSGEVLQTLAGKPAAFVTFLNGYSLLRPSVQHCFTLGAVLAALHLGGLDFPVSRKNALSLSGWNDLLSALDDRADRVCVGMTASLSAEYATIRESWPAGLPQGVIHADLFPNNVLFFGDKISGVIDFYFACNDLFAYDLAICLNAWCFEQDHSFNVTKARAMLKGYGSVRPLDQAELDALPLLARGAALRFLLTRLLDWFETPETALVKRLDPLEYWRKLTFHRDVKSVSAYGL